MTAMEWPQSYGRALERAFGTDLGLSDEEVEIVLGLARDVAHATERRYAPLAAYVTGKFVLDRFRTGVLPAQALDDAVAVARELLEAGDGDSAEAPGAGS
jgi:hypothetical protein